MAHARALDAKYVYIRFNSARLLTLSVDQRPPGMAPPHAGFQQPYTQNAGYGYGGYRPESGYPAGAAPGAVDPYASYAARPIEFLS